MIENIQVTQMPPALYHIFRWWHIHCCQIQAHHLNVYYLSPGVANWSSEARVSSSSMITESRVEVRRPASGSGSNSNHRQIQSVQPEILIRQLCTFFQKEGGSVSSAHVVEHFRDRVSNHDLSLFRQLLKQIAILEKRPHESKWVLKPEYQEQQ